MYIHTTHSTYTIYMPVTSIQTQVKNMCHGHTLTFTYHTDTGMHTLTMRHISHIHTIPHTHIESCTHAYTYPTAHVYIRYV